MQPDLLGSIEQLDKALVAVSAVSSNKSMRRKLYIFRAMANAKTNQLDAALADLKEVLRLDPEDATAIRYQASLRHLLAARFAKKGPSRYVPTLLSQDRFLAKAGEVGAYKSRFEDTLYDCRRDRQYPEFKRKGKAFTGERESSGEEEEEEEEPSPWDYILRRVRDILVDGDDEKRTRALLLEHVGTLVVMYVYYCRLGSLQAPTAGAAKFQAIHPVRITPKQLTAKALARFDSLFTVTGLPPYLISLRQFWQFAKDCGVVGDECSVADCSRIFVLASREFDPEDIDIIAGGRAGATRDELDRENARKEEDLAWRSGKEGQDLQDEHDRNQLEKLREGIEDANEFGQTVGGSMFELDDEISPCDFHNPHNPHNKQHVCPILPL